VIAQARAKGSALSVRRMCQVLGVNRAWYYAHQRPVPTAAPPVDEPAICQALRELAKEFPRYGYRRMTAALHRQGYQVKHKRVVRLLHALQLVQARGRRRVVYTTQSKHGLRVSPNLIHDLQLSRLNQLWVADLTYIHLPEDFIYLAALLDAYSRRCIGWQLSRRLDSQLALDALHQALRERHPPAGWIHHSDRGVQYASHASVERLQEAGAHISMSGKATPLDNAQAESFFKTVKVEEVYLHTYQTLEEAQQQLAHFLDEVYNQKRLHASLGYRPPAEFEAQFLVLS
jgi:putative transposase